jgi:hypothetical protein
MLNGTPTVLLPQKNPVVFKFFTFPCAVESGTGTISSGDQPIAECNKSSGLQKRRRNPAGPPIRPFRGTKEGFFKQ